MHIALRRLTLEEWQEATRQRREWGDIRYSLAASIVAKPASATPASATPSFATPDLNTPAANSTPAVAPAQIII